MIFRSQWLIGAAIFSLPLFFLPGAEGEPIRVAKEMAIVCYGALAAWVLLERYVHWILGVGAVFLAANLLASGFGPLQKENLLQVVCSLLASLMVFRLGERERVHVFKWFVWSGVLMTIYACFQMADLDPIFNRKTGEYISPVATLGQPTLFGSYVAAAAVAALALRMWTPFVIMSAMVLYTTSIFSSFALAAGTVVVLHHWVNRRWLWSGIVLVSVSFLASFFAFGVWESMDKGGFFHDHSRRLIWTTAIKHTAENRLLTGFGIGSFKVLYAPPPVVSDDGKVRNTVYPGVQPADVYQKSGRFIQAHNDLVQIFFEGGLVGLFVVASILMFFFTHLFEGSLVTSEVVAGSVAAAMIANGMGSFPLYLASHGPLIMLGLVIVLGRGKKGLVD